jgi:hypothetical protein
MVHKSISFDEAEKKVMVHKTGEDSEIRIVPYDFLKDMKLRSRRDKDIRDIVQLEELRNLPDNP